MSVISIYSEYFDGDIDFFPSGIPGYRGYPFKESMGRTLIVSPFLTKNFLDGLNLQSNDNTLISSSDSLDELPDNTRNRFKQIFTLNELAEPESQDTSSIDEDLTKSNIELSNAELSGLHAKLFIWESGWDANWLVGSANATNAAFLSNVEFMVKLTGKKSRVGVEAVLGDPNEENTFFRLLR